MQGLSDRDVSLILREGAGWEVGKKHPRSPCSQREVQ